ncbi:hypothetical protein KKI24_09955 [bacterium]|nr:hypothetical protein [bacterium]
MKQATQFYINGEWVDPIESRQIDVVNPATEQPVARARVGANQKQEPTVKGAVPPLYMA